MSQTQGTARGRKKLTPEEWKLVKDHLTIVLDHDKDTVEIGWANKCKEESCTIPHSTVIFFSCPERPCPRA
jgi:hypothetical protein